MQIQDGILSKRYSLNKDKIMNDWVSDGMPLVWNKKNKYINAISKHIKSNINKVIEFSKTKLDKKSNKFDCRYKNICKRRKIKI